MGRPLPLCRRAAPEAPCDILEVAGLRLAVEPLIGRRAIEGAEMADVRSDLDVVEICLAYRRGNAQTTAIPSHMILWMVLVDVLRQQVHSYRVTIATHESNAGDVMTILPHKRIDGIGVQLQTYVLPQIVAVAAGAATRTPRDVDGQRHLIGDLLKNNTGVYVLQHAS